MIKNLLKILILLLILFLLFIGYFSYFGFTTSKFNSTIKDQIKKQNDNLDIDLKKVKLHLDLKNISIKIKTKNPKIILKDLDEIKLDEISSNISISSYFQNKFAIKNLSIKSKNNEISGYINFYTHTNNSLKLILLNQFLKRGMAQINIDLNFDDSGKIKKDYSLKGKVSNAEIQIPKYKSIRNLNFTFNAKDNDYKFEKILFKFNEINLNSNFLEIKKQKDKFIVKGNLKNKKDKINNDLILLIFNDNLKNFDFSNTKFESISDSSFDINKKFKIKNLKIDSKLNLDEFLLKYDLYKIKNYIKNYNNTIKLKKNIIHIKYLEKKILIDGSSEFYIEKDSKNLLNFKFEKGKNKTNFETFFNLRNIDLKFDDISYRKIKKKNATLQIKGSNKNKTILFKKLNYNENNNKIEINNLIKLKENKIHIKYSKKKVLIDGSSEFYIEKNLKNLLNFKITKSKNKTSFETDKWNVFYDSVMSFETVAVE